MPLLDKLEYWVTRSCDWGPGLGLRPPKNVRMETGWVAGVSLLLGPISGAGAILLVVADEGGIGFAGALFLMNFSTVFNFLAFRFVIAYFWNRRAERLREESNKLSPD